jgi:hypothetical protein
MSCLLFIASNVDGQCLAKELPATFFHARGSTGRQMKIRNSEMQAGIAVMICGMMTKNPTKANRVESVILEVMFLNVNIEIPDVQINVFAILNVVEGVGGLERDCKDMITWLGVLVGFAIN